jgi:hypothetical protein
MNLVGRWRIIEMDLWDREAIELLGPGYIEFGKDGMGSFRFIAVEGWSVGRFRPTTDQASSSAGTGPTNLTALADEVPQFFKTMGLCGATSIYIWAMIQGFGPNGSIATATRTRCDPVHIERTGDHFLTSRQTRFAHSDAVRVVTSVATDLMEERLIPIRPSKLLGFRDCGFRARSAS